MTTLVKRTFLLVTGLVLLVLVSACGSSTTTGSQSTPTPVPSTPTPSPTPVNSLIHTAQATVGGKTETILTNAQGMTLYYFTPDTATKLACTGGCAKAWPPLLSTDASTPPTSSTALPGALTVLPNANGNQIEYSGYFLYTYEKDTAPGQVTGQGVGKVWYVATPDMASFVIRTAKVTVAGKTETIFTNAQGMALYYFTPDTATKLACAGGCATAWPPLLATSTATATPLADVPLTGPLSILNDANGNQIEYNGHLLYTYAKDTVGQTNGQGLGGKWFLATPTLAAA